MPPGPAGLFRVAVVGGGPSGFYAAEALLRAERGIAVDMFERLPVPYGLVRFGVAPDHPKLKQVTRVFDRIAKTQGFRFFGGVDIGEVVSIEALRASYHAVVLATGAPVSRPLQLPGEDLPGSHQAGDFVAWYNGHPDFRHCTFDFSGERAVIVGHGNVALDVARILAKTADELRHTDIAAHALEPLAASRIREIHVVGRRGPEQTRFAAKELEEFADLAECDPAVVGDALPESAGTDAEAEAALMVLRMFSRRPAVKRRRCVFHFGLSPRAIEGRGRVERMRFGRSLQAGAAADDISLGCDLVFSSIGRRAAALAGVPFDAERGVHANIDGRLIANGVPLPGLYVCGWGKRGPQGTIGTNRGCSVETVERILADLPVLAAPSASTDQLLGGVPGRCVDYAGWERIDAEETARGRVSGKPREKVVAIDEMFAIAEGEATC